MVVCVFDLFGSSVVWLLALFWYWLCGVVFVVCFWGGSGWFWVGLFVIMIVAARLTALVLVCLVVVFGWIVCYLAGWCCRFVCFAVFG